MFSKFSDVSHKRLLEYLIMIAIFTLIHILSFVISNEYLYWLRVYWYKETLLLLDTCWLTMQVLYTIQHATFLSLSNQNLCGVELKGLLQEPSKKDLIISLLFEQWC